MPVNVNQTLIDLETRFWQSMIDQDTDVALSMLAEPSMMVSSHGAMKFDHAAYRKMAEEGAMKLSSFELSDMQVVSPNDNTAIVTYRVKQKVGSRDKSGKGTTQEMADSSTWVRASDGWKCVMHTETPLESQATKH